MQKIIYKILFYIFYNTKKINCLQFLPIGILKGVYFNNMATSTSLKTESFISLLIIVYRTVNLNEQEVFIYNLLPYVGTWKRTVDGVKTASKI